jgi:precorrin-6B methylase 2
VTIARTLAIVLALIIAPAWAQSTTSAFQPEVGQAGKDVVWVPTPQVLVDKMLDMAKLTPKDFLMDLGSGDGRTVITAAKRGARAVGIEYNPDMVELSKRNAIQAGVGDKAAFMKADLFETDLSKATVITMFLLPDINIKLRPKLLKLRPGTRVVSNSFTMGEWKADEIARLSSEQGCTDSWCTALLWIIPAQVAGTYTVPQGELTLKQEFQVLSGTLKTAERIVPLEGIVRGDAIQFTAGGREYRGVLKGRNLVLQDK